MSDASDISRRRLLEMAAAIAAGTTSTFGQALTRQELGLPPENVTVLRSKNPRGGSWPEVVAAGLAKPLGVPRLRAHDLRGKRVVVIGNGASAGEAEAEGSASRFFSRTKRVASSRSRRASSMYDSRLERRLAISPRTSPMTRFSRS